jgi:putative FmdB family regulatory protein
MPSYKYHCPKCGNISYKVCSISEYISNPNIICDKCNTQMNRDYNSHQVGIIFKTKGFYSTDN